MEAIVPNASVERGHDGAERARAHLGRGRGPGSVLLALFFGVSLIPIWATNHFPSQNGPWFLLPTHMFKEYGDSRWDYAQYYVRNWHPIPHMLHDSAVGLVSCVAPLLIAEKIVLSLYVVLLPASVFYLLGVVAPEKRHLAYLSFLMVYSYPFLRGYHDFTLSIPLFFFALGYWLRHRDHPGIRHRFVLPVLGAFVYLAHLFTFALLAGTVAWIGLFETRRPAKALGASLLVTWPGWILFADYVAINTRATWLNASDTSWLPLHWTVENFIRQYFHSVSVPAYVAAVLPWTWLAVPLLVALAACRGNTRKALFAAIRHPFGSLLLFLVLAYLTLPYKCLGWHKVNVRLVPFVLPVFLACVGQMPGQWMGTGVRRAFVATTLVALLAVVGFTTVELVRMDAMLCEYTSGIDAFEANSRLFVVHSENPAFGQIRPITRAHEYYHVKKGGANGYSLPALNTLSLMWYRTYPVDRVFPRFDPHAPRESMESIRKEYDYALLWGEDRRWVERLEDHGFEPVHHRGRLRLFRNRSELPSETPARAVTLSTGEGCRASGKSS